MITGFSEGTKQFCYETRIAVKASNKSIKINCQEECKKFVKYQEKNVMGLDLGIKSINDKWDFVFNVDNNQFED